MDRVINNRKSFKLKYLLLIPVLATIIIYIFRDNSISLKVERDRIMVTTIKKGLFEDYLPVNGKVEPFNTIEINGSEGGKVEKIIIEEGAVVNEGDTIAIFSNPDLQLTIMNREDILIENNNNLRNSRLLMESNKLDIKKQILELEYTISQERKIYNKRFLLNEDRYISDEKLEESHDRVIYLTKKLSLLKEGYKQDSIFRGIQIFQLESAIKRMENNFNILKQRLDNLLILSPMSGQLSSLTLTLGERKGRGEFIGRVDDLSSFNIKAQISEYYGSRVKEGLKAQIEVNGEIYTLKIAKIYPEIRDGQFLVDLTFIDNHPKELRVGQTIKLDITLSSPQKRLLLSKGEFYSSTGGEWVYKVDKSGKFAKKQRIKIGKQNPRFYEIISGLEEGDKVIRSSYDRFENVDQLIIE